MPNPVILAVDDDSNVLNAVARDLRRQYSNRYRVLRADSGASALEALRQLKQRGDPVALFLVDQRMPQMSGVEFLAQACQFYPDAKRVLLTAYADTNAAIQAINDVAVHHYLVKPWDPPEEALYPVLDDLLEDWQGGYRPPFEGIRVIGHRWSPEAHTLKEFLARNHVPYLYLDVELNPEAKELVDQLNLQNATLPVLIFADGEVMECPSVNAVAQKVGLKTTAAQPFYDMAIVGAGPAGLAAAVYGASEGLHTVMIEREAPGGQAGTSSSIENYLGFPSGLSGGDLARRATVQARRFGVEIIAPQEVTGLRVDGLYRYLTLANGTEISCHVVIIAVGLEYRRLEVPGAERLAGAGVYYGATLTEAIPCQGQDVFIVGAGNSAGQAAMYLSRFASRVHMVVRSDDLGKRMSQYLVERIEAMENITVHLESEITAVDGESHLEQVTLRHSPSQTDQVCPAQAVFIFIGARPCTGWLQGVVALDDLGFILAGPQVMVDGKRPPGWDLDRDPFLLETSVPGIFVVGDARASSVKRVASAVGEGSIAVQFVHQYLSKVR